MNEGQLVAWEGVVRSYMLGEIDKLEDEIIGNTASELCMKVSDVSMPDQEHFEQSLKAGFKDLWKAGHNDLTKRKGCDCEGSQEAA